MRIRLIVADSRRSAPAEDGKSKNGQPFALCAVSRQTGSPIIGNVMPMARNRAKRKNVGRPKGETAASADTVGQWQRQLKAGDKLL